MYRILTEKKGNVRRILDRYFDGYTLYSAVGSWKGKREPSLVAEIEGLGVSLARVRQAAREIKRQNHQDAVLVQTLVTKGELV